MTDRERWNRRYRTDDGPTTPNARLVRLKYLLTRGIALDLACGIGQNSQVLCEWTVVLADVSEEALARAKGFRVQCEAPWLPFAANSFDTIICTFFFEPRVEYSKLLKPRGTLFFETMVVADAKYHPESNPAHRFDPRQRDELFRDLETLFWQEIDDGKRVFATFIGRKRN